LSNFIDLNKKKKKKKKKKITIEDMFIGHRSLRLLGGTPEEYIAALINILDSPVVSGKYIINYLKCIIYFIIL